MKAEDFTMGAPGRLIPTVHGAAAFVPDPLPVGLPLETPTVRLLAQAENSLGKLVGTTAREFNPYLVGSPLLHREAILSSRIEGTVTTPEQLVLLQAETAGSREPRRADHETREVLNYVRSMQSGLKLLNELPVCLRLIKEVHKVLLTGVRGERERPGQFRTDQNWVRGKIDDSIENARYVPPPVGEMTAALDAFEHYLNRKQADDSDPVLIQLALIHYQFEAIHPFRDGNGRIGRLLIPLLLCHHNRIETPLLYLSAFFERNRDVYIDLLLHVSQTCDWTSWLNFFLRGVRESAEEARRQAIGLLDLRQRYHRQVQTTRSSALLIRLVDELFQVPSVTINHAAELLEISHQAAAGNIRKLEAAGILRESTGRRRNQIFIADEILAFMYDTQPTSPSTAA